MEITWLKKIKEVIRNKIEFVIFCCALFLGSVAILFFYKRGMLTVLVDENAHLNIARQLIDSMTPGFSQLGLWPPLIHIVISPFVQIDFLWHSGLAGSIPSVLFFAITCVYVFKTVKLFSKDNLPAILSVIVFGFNPYVLYFSTVAMMEMLFFMNFIIATYYFMKWIKNDYLFNLIICALFITLSCLTRFEGFILPIILIAIILIRYLLLRKKYPQIESIVIIFSMLSCFGIFLILLYNIVFAGNPFAFISGEWSAYAQQHEGGYILPAKGNFLYASLYMLSAAKYMISIELILISLIIFFVLILRKNYLKIILLVILIVPFVFNIISLFKGNSVVYTPDFHSNNFLNVRYGLSLIPFVSISIGIFLASFLKRKKIISILKYCYGGIIVVMVFTFLIFNLSYNDSIIVKDAKNYPSKEMIQSAKIFKKEYDGGKLLITRGINDFFTKNSGINISDMIQESNYIYWEQSLEEPWLFARWVVALNPDSSMIWEVKKDEISTKWIGDNKIYEFYDVVLKNDTYIILKINENAMMDYVKENNLNINKMPSMNISIKHWDPSTIKNEIENEK